MYVNKYVGRLVVKQVGMFTNLKKIMSIRWLGQ
jgi:hypothetical protein